MQKRAYHALTKPPCHLDMHRPGVVGTVVVDALRVFCTSYARAAAGYTDGPQWNTVIYTLVLARPFSLSLR